jgi:hypothetical protein
MTKSPNDHRRRIEIDDDQTRLGEVAVFALHWSVALEWNVELLDLNRMKSCWIRMKW